MLKGVVERGEEIVVRLCEATQPGQLVGSAKLGRGMLHEAGEVLEMAPAHLVELPGLAQPGKAEPADGPEEAISVRIVERSQHEGLVDERGQDAQARDAPVSDGADGRRGLEGEVAAEDRQPPKLAALR